MSAPDRWPEADEERPHPGLGSTCQTGPPSDSHVDYSRKAQEQKRVVVVVVASLGKLRQDLRQRGVDGRRACSGPDGRVCNIWFSLWVSPTLQELTVQ